MGTFLQNWMMLRAQSAPRGGSGDGIEIPTVYQRVEYIQSNGAQYIDTGVLPESTTALELDAAITSVSTSYYAADLAGVFAAGFRFHIGVYENKFHFGIGGDFSSWINLTNFDTDRHTFKICGDGEYSLDAITGMLSPVTESQFSIYLLGRNGPDVSASPCIVWRSKIYDNGVLVRDFIPCYRKSDGKPGMWDMVSWQFFTNAGSGADFTVGPDVIQPATKYIVFEDKAVEAICVANFSSDGIGVTMADAAAVTGYISGFSNNTQITAFPELVYFSGGLNINTQRFIGCTSLRSVGFPPNCIAFQFPDNVPIEYVYVTDLAGYLSRPPSLSQTFSGAPSTGVHLYVDGAEAFSVVFPPGTTTLPAYVLAKHKYLTQIMLPDSVRTIGAGAFSQINCNITLPNGLTTILSEAFSKSAFTGNFVVPSTVTTIAHLSFPSLTALSSITFLSTTPPVSLDNGYGFNEPFRGTTCPIYVPYSADHSILDAYKVADGWSRYASQIHELDENGNIPS